MSTPSQPIVTVNIMGGLGNQLFQIAAAYAYARKWGGRLAIHRKTENGKRPVYWDTLLQTMEPYLVPLPLPLSSLSMWHEVDATVYSEPPPLPPNGIQLNGYLQSSKYYTAKTAGEIRALFRQPATFPLLPLERFLLEHRDRVVVVHARRTDYLTYREVHGPLEGAYYRRAVDRMLTHLSNPIFLLSSDDPAFWTELTASGDLAVMKQHPVITLDFPYSDIQAFRLLQQFQYYILSNSTFIWWCAWLSENTKHVIAPSRWFGPEGPAQYEDIYEPSWERVSPQSH